MLRTRKHYMIYFIVVQKKVINPVARRQFLPSPDDFKPNLDGLLDALYDSCSSSCAFQYALPTVQPNFPPEADVNVESEEEIKSIATIPPSLSTLASNYNNVEDFIASLPIFDQGSIDILQNVTMGQSEQWFEQRKGRITGSVAHRVVTRMKTVARDPETDTTNLLKSILGKTTPTDDIPALKYGRSMEPNAKIKYQEIMKDNGYADIKLQDCGLSVVPDKIFLGATPDGIVRGADAIDGLLEIKCPFSICNEVPTADNLPYLNLSDNGEIHLHKKHAYYYQIQTQLGVFKMSWCDFFVFTHKGYFLERVYFNDSVWTEIVKSAEFFFLNYVAKELVEPNVILSKEIVTLPAYKSKTSADLCKRTNTKTKKVQPKLKVRQERPLYFCKVCQKECKDIDDFSDENEDSVACDSCNNWFHCQCVNFEAKNINNSWFCSSCPN